MRVLTSIIFAAVLAAASCSTPEPPPPVPLPPPSPTTNTLRLDLPLPRFDYVPASNQDEYLPVPDAGGVR